MGNGYSERGWGILGHLAQPSKAFLRITSDLPDSIFAGRNASSLDLSRLVFLMQIVMLLLFASVFRLTDTGGVHAFWVELTLALSGLSVLAGSYSLPLLRRHLTLVVRLFSYAAAGLFISLAAANGFGSNYAVGLLLVLPALGAGCGVAARNLASLGAFFVVSTTGAAAACLATTGATPSAILFSASLMSITLMTTFVAAGWLNVRKKYLASEERFRAVVEQASDGIFMLDVDTLTVLDANPAFCRITGISRFDLRQRHVDAILSSPEGEPLCFGDLKGERSRRAECMVRTPEGTFVTGEVKIDRIFHEEGDVYSVVFHDITSRKEYEGRLVRAKEHAEDIARFKSALLANMSHELRTPLTSIIGWTSVLGKEVSESQRELVQLIECSGKRLHHTLDSVLELAHLHARTKELRPSVVDVAAEISHVADVMRCEAERKGLAFSVVLGNEEYWARVDASCLRRVLSHLVDNAVKFTEVGGIEILVSGAGGEIAVQVHDTGVGISREFIDSVFEEFKQESAGLTRSYEGSGLGLAIVQRLVDLIGGRIDVQSERGVGTVFTVYLPEVNVSAAAA